MCRPFVPREGAHRTAAAKRVAEGAASSSSAAYMTEPPSMRPHRHVVGTGAAGRASGADRDLLHRSACGLLSRSRKLYVSKGSAVGHQDTGPRRPLDFTTLPSAVRLWPSGRVRFEGRTSSTEHRDTVYYARATPSSSLASRLQAYRVRLTTPLHTSTSGQRWPHGTGRRAVGCRTQPSSCWN